MADLDDIWVHIALDDMDAAERVLDELEQACVQVALHPGIGHVREDLAEGNIRFWTVRSWLVVYRADRNPIEIVRFWHGAQHTLELP